MSNVKNRIFIVDDDRDFAESLVDLLKHNGFETRVATSVAEAIEVIAEFDADLALLDIRLGRDSGISLISDLQKARPGILCVIMTAYAAIDSAIEALKLGAYDYLRKPLSAGELLAVVNRCFNLIKLRDEKEAAVQSLARSEERFRTLIETMREGLVIQDRNGFITYANERFCEMLNRQRDEIHGRSVNEFLDTDSMQLFIEHSGRRSSENKLSLELLWVRKNGGKIPTITSPCILTDSIGDIIGSFEVVTDITQQKMGEEFIRAQRDLGLALSEFVDLKEALKQVLDVAMRISGMDMGSVFLKDKTTGAYDLVHYEGSSSEFARKLSYKSPDCQYVKNLQAKVPLYYKYEDVGLFVDEVIRREGLRGYAIIPVVYEDEVIATMNVGSHYLNEIPDGIKPALEAIASQIGGVLKRVEAEEKLIKEKTTLDSIITLNPYSIVVFDSHGKYIRANRSFIELFGILPNQKNSMFEDVFLAKDEFAKQLAKVRMGEIARVLEVWFNPRDISPEYTKKNICLSATFFPIFASHGGVENIILMLEDITSEKQIEQAVLEAENRFKSLIECAQDAIFIKDKSLRYTFINSRMKQIFNFEDKDVIGKTDQSIDPPEMNKISLSTDSQVISGNVVEYESGTGIEGDDRVFHLIKAPMKNSKGETIGICGIARDITDRRKFEKQLLDYQSQLQELASQISITEENERRRLSYLLHDRIGQTLAFSKIKLGLINEELALEELDRKGLSEKVTEIIDLIEQSIDETRSLTFQLSPPVLYELGFVSAVEWLTEHFRERFDLDATVIKGENLITLNDKLKGVLFQCVRELLLNVAKHSQVKKASVEILEKDGMITVAVTDNGVGFDPDSISFDKGGTGFGLFSLKERLKHFNGQLSVESQSGKGAKITITVPVANAI